jgi:succinate-semialdehyde dehydrogenase/glutarate-semialdehyde dehydrogenase
MAYLSFDPYKQELISKYQTDTDRSIIKKVSEVQTDYEKWSRFSLQKRCDMLNMLADIIMFEKDDHAQMIVKEMGKPISQAVSEIEKCALLCRFYAANAEDYLAGVERKSGARKSIVYFEPQGIIMGIMPWNFPYWQVFRFFVPALAAGNCAVLKHSSNVTGCALKIEQSVKRAGFPESVFRVLLPDHSQIEKIISMPEIRGVALTGSNEAGSAVALIAGKYIKKTVLELGGSDPLIIFPDADIGLAAAGAFTGRFLNCGQSCIAAKRIIVHNSVYEEFLESFIKIIKETTVGDPSDKNTFIGPMVSRTAAEDIDALVKRSVEMGAGVIVQGGLCEDGPAFFRPAVLCDIPPQSPLESEEVFGPVAPIFTFGETDVATEMANSSKFGLGASVWTSDHDFGLRFARTLDTGSVFINGYVRSDPGLPFGGVKDSGYGRELSLEGIREFVNTKSIAFY